jgi:hypothetical protein
MVELRVALEAVRNRGTQWDTVADIRAWLDASAPPPRPPPAPSHQPPAAPAVAAAPAAAAAAAAAVADAEAAAAAAKGEVEERAFASAFSWDAAKRGAEADLVRAGARDEAGAEALVRAGAARDEAGAEADEAQQGDRGAEGGRELRVMERMAANLRDELEHKYTWFRLVRAAPDAAAAACSQVTGRGALGLALHCTWGAGVTREGLGGGWGCRRSRRPSTS